MYGTKLANAIHLACLIHLGSSVLRVLNPCKSRIYGEGASAPFLFATTVYNFLCRITGD